MTKSLIYMTLTAAAVIAAPAKAQDRAQREKFAGTVVRLDGELTRSKKDFAERLKPFREGAAGDVSGLAASYQTFAMALERAKVEMRDTSSPADPDCVQLRNAFIAYLSAEDSVSAELASIVKRVRENGGKLDLLGKLETIGSLRKCGQVEDAAWATVTAAVRAYDQVDRTIR